MARTTTAVVTTKSSAKSKQLEVARAEVKELRAKRKAEAAAGEAAVQQHVDEVQPALSAANIEALVGELPSAKRVVIGLVLGFAAAFAVGYGIGIILSYILAGITVLFGAGLIAFVLKALAWIAAIYACWKSGGWVSGKVFSAVVLPDGLAAKSFESLGNAASDAKQRVSGWFGSNAPVTQAA